MAPIRPVDAATATIIAFPGARASEAEPDVGALLKRAWRATERLICALPSTTHADQAKVGDNLAAFVGAMERLALAAENEFKAH